jgi:uncharacterized membrane protein YjjP (DUF1212 family)
MIMNFGHGGEAQEITAERASLIDALVHQPTWLSLILIIFFMFALYNLLEKLKVKPMNRVLVLLPVTLLIAIIYLQHDPLVTTVVLIAGFVVTFILAFTLMRGRPQGEEAGKDQK